MRSFDGQHFDVVVIGAGMSGLAAGIRLALAGKSVLIAERHNVAGGLNSFYSFDGRRYDVGLHALTNYVRPGTKGTPLVKLLRQLRIPREAFDLAEQKYSRIAIPGAELRFTNDFEVLEGSVATAFPRQAEGFRKLADAIRAMDETALDAPEGSAREFVAGFIDDPVLADMIFLPVMYYGNARAHDMDLPQFAIMFKALFFEGFARPYEGVRTIIRALLEKYRSLGGQRQMKNGVRCIHAAGGKVARLEMDNGDTLTAERVLSSIGLNETLRLCDDQPPDAGADNTGPLSFVETITVTNRQPRDFGWEETIVFFNNAERFTYARPGELVDPRSGVICFPNNYQYPDGRELAEGFYRVTAMANHDRWCGLPEEDYRAAKEYWFRQLREASLRFLAPVDLAELEALTVATDMFTPRTIRKYTGHIGGAVYGAPSKTRQGRTHLENLFICGTDQGFLGITGAMLSGISMANLHCLSVR